MKLIIDIPEEDYKKVSRIVNMGLGTNVDEAIKNGTPLDDVRAEIGQLPSYVAKFAGGDFAIHIDKEKVLQIIDKYLAESEG